MSEENGKVYGSDKDKFHKVRSEPTEDDMRRTRTLAMKVMQESDEWMILGRKLLEVGKYDIAHGGLISNETLATIMVQLMVNNRDLRAKVFAIYARALDVFFDPKVRRDVDEDGEGIF